MKLVGRENIEYTSKKTGELVTGVKLHCVGKSDRIDGDACDIIFVSAKNPMYAQCLGFPLGSEIAVGYNRYGSVETINLKK